MRAFVFLCFWVGLSVSVFGATAPDFEKEVQPILETACMRCHGPGKEKGGLQLHTREAFLKGGDTDAGFVVGDAEHSLFIERVVMDPADDEIMPQESEPLAKEQVDILQRWVATGAAWPEGIRLKARGVELAEEDKVMPESAPKDLKEAVEVVDSLIVHENRRRGLLEVEGIDDLGFLRRATLDVIGRIPTYEEIVEFEGWKGGDRREKLVDRLLADGRYADRWAVFLADTLRVRSNQSGGRELQAWLHGQVAENVAWDEISRELISANGRTSQSPAVGFVLNDDADPMSMAAATSQIFLGVRLACAQCHDHPFDDWQQMEFYEMASFFGKTVRQENRFAGTVYTTEGDEMKVQWPPERLNPPKREAVKPRFPFELVSFQEKPHFISRLEKRRMSAQALVAAEEGGDSLDSLLDDDLDVGGGLSGFDILAEAKKASEDLKVQQDLYKPSELRAKLADMVTHPRNPYFARSFVNRVWAELNGRGFVEPLDNFSEYQANTHPQTLEYLGREFVASGYDLKALIKMMMLTKTYARGHAPADTSVAKLNAAEKYFTASPVRRMISEALFDSIVVAGHLERPKWRKGENVRVMTSQIRVPIQDGDEGEMAAEAGTEVAMSEAGGGAMMAGGAMMGGAMSAGTGYSLEAGIELDFEKVLADSAAQEDELSGMRAMADAQLEEERRRREMMEARRRQPQRYSLKTIQEEVDDNPSFNTTMRMASPAPADHFLRVFGQPSREGLGEFRDHQASLRQQLMMLNGKATHDASRVGSLEPLHAKLTGANADLGAAVDLVYLEALTRKPTAEEKADAVALLEVSESPVAGMADLRWALFNCHEFRFLP